MSVCALCLLILVGNTMLATEKTVIETREVLINKKISEGKSKEYANYYADCYCSLISEDMGKSEVIKVSELAELYSKLKEEGKSDYFANNYINETFGCVGINDVRVEGLKRVYTPN